MDTPPTSVARSPQKLGAQALLLFREPCHGQRVVALQAIERVTIGRRSAVDVSLSWDPEVSRLHAELVRVGGEWTLVDDGLSANGSFVNGARVHGRRRLHDGDVVRVGGTDLLFREARETGTPPTDRGGRAPARPEITHAQRRVLIALCRPFGEAPAFAVPATNEAIADELFLTSGAVKKHLRALFARFDLSHLAQNEKRVRLAEQALATGAVSPDELERPPGS